MYQMKKGGSSKSAKQRAAIAISMKAAGKKPKKMAKGGPTKTKSSSSGPGPKKTAFQNYVDKYPGSASDTTARFDPRYNWRDNGFAGERAQQNKDLKTAFTKTYGKRNMTGIDEEDESKYRIKQKMGGSIGKKPKKMEEGGPTSKKVTTQRAVADNTRVASNYKTDIGKPKLMMTLTKVNKIVPKGSMVEGIQEKEQGKYRYKSTIKKLKPKMAKGGSFPDLTGDGKVTKADILKGRGVIKKYGGSIKSKKK